jgi:hypothetical protein
VVKVKQLLHCCTIVNVMQAIEHPTTMSGARFAVYPGEVHSTGYGICSTRGDRDITICNGVRQLRVYLCGGMSESGE